MGQTAQGKGRLTISALLRHRTFLRAGLAAANSAIFPKTGARDNGKPGLREDYDPNYYAAFVVDPEGYRIEAYCGKAE